MPYFKRDGDTTSVFTNTVPLSTAATYSSGISLERGEFFGFWLSAAPASCVSAGAITTWYELAPSDSSTLYVCAGNITVGVSALSGGTFGTASAFSISPIPMPWIRFGCSATSGGNLSANRMSATAKLFTQ